MTRQSQFQKGVKRLLARDARYAEAAYAFVRDAVTQAHKRKVRGGSRQAVHVSCAELLEAIRRHALDEFGPLALQVLNEWGIQESIDFGNIVFLMIEEGLLGAGSGDSQAAFGDAFDFRDAFVKPFVPTGRPVSPPVIDEEP